MIKAGVFTITPGVTASVRFDPDYRSQQIGVRLTNVDRFESVNLEFRPEQFVEAAFEDLIRMTPASRTRSCAARRSRASAPPATPAIDEPIVYRVEKTLRQHSQPVAGSTVRT